MRRLSDQVQQASVLLGLLVLLAGQLQAHRSPVSTATTSDESATLGGPSSIAEPAKVNSSGPAPHERYSDLLVLDPLQQVWADASSSPRSDKQQVLDMFHKFFVRPRSHDDQAQKELVRDGVILRLRELGFETSFLQKSRFEFRRRPATSYNMISILAGKSRQTKRDRIVLIGAHWDSYTKAPVSS